MYFKIKVNFSSIVSMKSQGQSWKRDFEKNARARTRVCVCVCVCACARVRVKFCYTLLHIEK